jgi:HAD superfamily hydrolase (TIGR01509 family)
MTRLQAVIFDFDGVLADSVPVYREAVTRVANQAGIDDPDAEQIAQADTWTVAQRIIRQYNLDVDTATLVRHIEQQALDRLLVTPSIVPGVQALIAALRAAGLQTAIASLAPRRNIEAVLAQVGMQNDFAAIITVEDVSRIKPDPEVYQKAAQAVGVTGSACVAIEDSDLGVSSALAAGMIAIALTTTFPAERLHHAHYICDRLENLTLDKLRRIHREAAGKNPRES